MDTPFRSNGRESNRYAKAEMFEKAGVLVRGQYRPSENLAERGKPFRLR
jgi:hypothetical protein